MTITSSPKEDHTGRDRCLNSILCNLWKPASEMPLFRAVHDLKGQWSQRGRLPPPGEQLQADRLTLLPGHCGHLSRRGQVPKSKIFAPQNTEEEICDSLLLPSFYRVDKKIIKIKGFPVGIICKGNGICLNFINPVIILATELAS